jgi:C-terminal processing protease CtpA/Prc
MRKYFLTSIVLVPLLLSFSHATQNWTVEPSGQPWVFASEEGDGTTSYLGVDITDVTTERLSALKLKEEKGVEVTMVDQDAPAGKAGLKEHDVILTMNGTAIESGAQLRRMIHETPPGRVVTLGLSRDGQPMAVKVQLADKHKEIGMGPKSKEFHFEMPDIHVTTPDIDIPAINMVMVTSSARSGLMVENITPQLGEFFGVKNGTGVLVRSVEKGSRAEKAGFHAGDVIVKVNNQAVHDTSDFAHAVKSRNGGSVSVGVMRDRKEQNLNLTLPDRKESGEMWDWDEESLGNQVIDAESAVELGELQQEVAKLRPEMELATEEIRKSEDQLRKSLCDQQKKLREQSQKQREQLRLQQKQLRNQVIQLRQVVRRTWADI